MRKPLLLIVALWLGISVRAAVDTPLEKFNQSETQEELASSANEFFKLLYDESFLDTLYVFTATTHADSIRSIVWYWAAEYSYDRMQYPQSLSYGLKALPLMQKGDDRKAEADCLNILAITCIRLGNYEMAVDYAKRCYQLDEASGDPERISMSLNTLAAIYMSAGQPQEAVPYVLKGIRVATDAGIDSKLAVLLGMASEVYHAVGDNQKSLDYADKAYQLELQLGHEHKAMVRLAQKASALIGLQDYEHAEELLRQVIPYFREVGNLQSLGISCNKLAMALFCLGHTREAVDYYREAAEIFQQLGDKNNEMHARKGLYEILWKIHPDSARMELERFNALKDSLYTGRSAESLARYNAEFGNDWLQEENEAERTAKRHVMLSAIVVSTLLILLSVAIWWVMRRRQHRQAAINQKLSANIEELREQYKELTVRYDNALITTPRGDRKKEVSAADGQFLEKTINVINEFILNGQVDAESVAGKMNMSLFQFRQRLASLTDETPQSFIAIIRMRRARYLLDNRPELNISEVAQLCAYNDTPNFTRAFKKTFGITPSQYLERQKA